MTQACHTGPQLYGSSENLSHIRNYSQPQLTFTPKVKKRRVPLGEETGGVQGGLYHSTLYTAHYILEECQQNFRVEDCGGGSPRQPFSEDFNVNRPMKKAPVIRHNLRHKALWVGNCVKSAPSLYTSTMVQVKLRFSE